jgi:hypothetical protein
MEGNKMGFGLEGLASAVMGAVVAVAEAAIEVATEVADVMAAQADIANILEDGQIDEDEQERFLDDINKLVVGAYLVGFGSIKFGSEDCSVSSWDDDSENYIIDFIQPNKVTDGAAVTFNENGYSDPKSVWDCFVGLKNYVEDKASDAYTATKNTFDKVKSVGYAIENGFGKFSTSTREGFNAVGEFLGLDYDRKQAGGKTQRELNEKETQRDNENSNKLRNEAPDKEIFDAVSKGTEKSLDAASLVLAAHGIINLGKAGMNLINLERNAWKMERNIKGAGNAVDELLNNLKSGKVKLQELSSDEQLKVAEALKDKGPLKIEGNVNINIREKNGYDDIQYKWSDGGYNYEMRWHTATPNAPEGTPPNWRVDRSKPGFPGGKDPVTGEKLQGYPSVKEVLIWPENGEPYYVSQDAWKVAGTAYRKGIATQEQLDMLKFGHYILD